MKDKRIYRKIIKVFYPVICPMCSKVILQDELICDECSKKLCYIKEPRCRKCGKKLDDENDEYCYDCKRIKHSYTSGRALFEYDDMVKHSIYKFKYENMRCHGEFYGQAISIRLREQIEQWKIDIIAPVPLHRKKKASRGFNQSNIIAKELSYRIGIPVYKNLLIRSRNTTPQKELTNSSRRKNMMGAFETGYCPNNHEGKNVLLIDDIYTTGSTIDECASMLIKAGFGDIYFITLAIGNAL